MSMFIGLRIKEGMGLFVHVLMPSTMKEAAGDAPKWVEIYIPRGILSLGDVDGLKDIDI